MSTGWYALCGTANPCRTVPGDGCRVARLMSWPWLRRGYPASSAAPGCPRRRRGRSRGVGSRLNGIARRGQIASTTAHSCRALSWLPDRSAHRPASTTTASGCARLSRLPGVVTLARPAHHGAARLSGVVRRCPGVVTAARQIGGELLPGQRLRPALSVAWRWLPGRSPAHHGAARFPGVAKRQRNGK